MATTKKAQTTKKKTTAKKQTLRKTLKPAYNYDKNGLYIFVEGDKNNKITITPELLAAIANEQKQANAPAPVKANSWKERLYDMWDGAVKFMVPGLLGVGLMIPIVLSESINNYWSFLPLGLGLATSAAWAYKKG